MPGQESYLDQLRSTISNLGLEDRVEIVLAAPSEKVVQILYSGLVQVSERGTVCVCLCVCGTSHIKDMLHAVSTRMPRAIQLFTARPEGPRPKGGREKERERERVCVCVCVYSGT